MERERLSKKYVLRNVFAVSALILVVFFVVYIVYPAGLQKTPYGAYEALAGRFYVSGQRLRQIYFRFDGKAVFQTDGKEILFESCDFADGVLRFEDSGQVYTFVLLSDERMFYDNGNEVLYYYGTAKDS